MECRHLDGDPSNNALGNLTWGTKGENVEDMKRHDSIPRGEEHPHSKLSGDDVLQMRKIHRNTAHGYRSIAKMFGVSKATAREAITGETWAHIGEGAA
jgi:hypothetical protein